jgi:hypothetical protein
MKYLITGGTGFIGSKLVGKLLAKGYEITVLTRNTKRADAKLNASVKFINLLDEVSGRYFDVIINLAGQGIADKNWNEKIKQELIDSRVNTTKNLVLFMAKMAVKPKVFISASAIGYYGFSETKIFSENSIPANIDSFSHKICAVWEAEALKAENFGVRTAITRIGIVLGKNGGALKKMITPFKLGLGGKIGNGNQWMSFVHLEDLLNAFEKITSDNSLTGVINLTSPSTVKNLEFAKTLAKVLNRPAFFNLPEKIVEVLFGEMGQELLLQGQRVIPEKLINSGFVFKYANLQKALEEILK